MKTADPILSALSLPVLILDGSLRAVLANPAFYQTLEIEPGILSGKSVHDLIAEDATPHPHLRQLLETVVNHDSTVEDAEVLCTLRPTKHKILSVTARRISLGQEPAELVLVELQDVTAEKEAEARILDLNAALRKHEAELEVINKDLESFSHSAAHDLRTPLRLMNKIAYLLIEDFGGTLPPGAEERIGIILDSTKQMGKLIDDLLKFSKIGQENLRKRRADPTRLARQALKDLQTEQRDQRQERNVTVEVESLPGCNCDRALLKLVFLNLLSNAIKFSRLAGHPEVRVGAEEVNGETVYFVRDNGVGFKMDQSHSMFQPFQRLHRQDQFEGSGLGLALASRIVERHGGRIWAESQVNKGATFYFTLGE